MSPRTCGWFWKVKIFDRFLRNQAWTLVLKLNLVACSWLKNYFSALCFGWKWRRRWTVKKNGGTDGNGRHAKLIDYDFDFQHQQGSCGRFEQRWRRLLPDGWRLLRSRRRHHGGSVGFRGELCTPFLKFDNQIQWGWRCVLIHRCFQWMLLRSCHFSISIDLLWLPLWLPELLSIIKSIEV